MTRKIQSLECESCGKRVRRDHMTQHRLVHLNQRSFVCPEGGCRREFSRTCHMIRHVKSKHKDYGKDSNASLQDSSGPSRLAPQAQFSTEAAGPNTSGNESKETILELRRENDHLRGQLARVELKMRAAIQEKAAAKKLKASLSKQIAKDHIVVATQRDLVADREKYRENLERWSKELDSVETRSKSLEVDDLSNMDIQKKVEEQNRIICDLQNRLELANHQLIEGERLRKKMHNTIMDLKGN